MAKCLKGCVTSSYLHAVLHLIHGQDRRVLLHELFQLPVDFLQESLEFVDLASQLVLHLVTFVAGAGLGEVEHGGHVLGPLKRVLYINAQLFIFC